MSSTMTTADWAALKKAGQTPGATAYLEDQANRARFYGQGAPAMSQADWAALAAAGRAGGTAYLEAQARAAQPDFNAQGNAQATPAAGTGANIYDANGNILPQADAEAILANELQSWGFGQDAVDWSKTVLTSNASIDQILFELRKQPFYVNSVYGQTNAARSAAGLPAMTEAQINAYKDYAVGVSQQAGLPTGFMSDQQVAKLAGMDVSTAELDSRITQGLTKAMQSDPLTLSTLQNYYGVTPGHLAAYYLDPTNALPLLQNQFASAQIGATAQRTGYGAIDQGTAMGLAQLGVTPSQAQTSFTKLGIETPLFNALPGAAGEQAITEGQQLGAEFGGNATDQMLIQQRAQQRQAAFQGQYKFAETAGRGITGLGAAPRNG